MTFVFRAYLWSTHKRLRRNTGTRNIAGYGKISRNIAEYARPTASAPRGSSFSSCSYYTVLAFLCQRTENVKKRISHAEQKKQNKQRRVGRRPKRQAFRETNRCGSLCKSRRFFGNTALRLRPETPRFLSENIGPRLGKVGRNERRGIPNLSKSATLCSLVFDRQPCPL